MISLIVTAATQSDLNTTCDSIIDGIPPDRIAELIIVSVGQEELAYRRQGLQVTIKPKSINTYGQLLNQVAKDAIGEDLLFVLAPLKWEANAYELLNQPVNNAIISPQQYGLDLKFWLATSECSRQRGLNWDLSIVERPDSSSSQSTPMICPGCFLINKQQLHNLAGFESSYDLHQTIFIDLSLRNWSAGGQNLVADSFVAWSNTITENQEELRHLAESWLGRNATRFYAARQLSMTEPLIAKIDNLPRKQFDSYLLEVQPELGELYELQNLFAGKIVAIVGDGPSLDMINPSFIQRADIIIGADLIATSINCDYVVSFFADSVLELLETYPPERILVPFALGQEPTTIAAGKLDPALVKFKLGQPGKPPASLSDQPIANYLHPVLASIHLAAFMGARQIELYGCDFKLLNGHSHCARHPSFNGGNYWPDTEPTRAKFAYYEAGLKVLASMITRSGIRLLRINHA